MLSFPPSPQARVFVAREPGDMHKGFDGVSASDGHFEMTTTDLAFLLDGIDLRGARRRLRHDDRARRTRGRAVLR